MSPSTRTPPGPVRSSTPTPVPVEPTPAPVPVTPTPTPRPVPVAPASTPTPRPDSAPPPPPTPSDPPPPYELSPPLPPGTPLPPPPPPQVLAPPPPYEPPPPPSLHSSSSVSVGLITGIGIGAVVVAALLLGLFIVILRRRPRRRDDPYHSLYAPSLSSSASGATKAHRQRKGPTSVCFSQPPPPSSNSGQDDNNPESRQSSNTSSENPPLSSVPTPAVSGGPFKYEDLVSATNGFAEWNLLGQGGFGLVYRGTLRGRDVAIKKLKSGSKQGEQEFRTEVEIISRVHHRNLVTLVGYCIHEDQRLLVYEYVPNKTLAFHLHGIGRPTLDWLRRWTIALGSAKALAYLHEDCNPKIIHRDIKATNILIDYNFEPKVADFGLAKFVPTDTSHVSTRVMGTLGYVAPEYGTSGKLTDRSDVYSYGVMLLELISGRKPVMGSHPHLNQSLVNWARPLLSRAMTEEIYDELIDPWLETNYDQHDMTRLIHCAAASVRQSAKKRPRMGQIVRYLEGEISVEDLNAGMMLAEVKGNSTEPEVLRRMAFGGIIRENSAESDHTS